MITFAQLNEQNHRITELSNVVSRLITERTLCDNKITCDLFFRYVGMVKDHLDIEEKALYTYLLTHEEPKVKNTANMFLSGSAEIRRVFNQYLHRWCHEHELRVKDHGEFVRDTQDMFKLVLKRIEDETEHLYPLVRRVAGDRIAA